MAGIKYDVPLIGQANDNSCWNASAQMIWSYWQGRTKRQGPMQTLDDVYARSKTSGIFIPDFVRLAQNAGMRKAVFSFPISKSDMAALLQKHGPLWCAGQWLGPGQGHIVVATGINDSIVSINDPWPKGKGKVSTRDIGTFNGQLDQQVPGCLMYKDKARY